MLNSTQSFGDIPVSVINMDSSDFSQWLGFVTEKSNLDSVVYVKGIHQRALGWLFLSACKTKRLWNGKTRRIHHRVIFEQKNQQMVV